MDLSEKTHGIIERGLSKKFKSGDTTWDTLPSSIRETLVCLEIFADARKSFTDLRGREPNASEELDYLREYVGKEIYLKENSGDRKSYSNALDDKETASERRDRLREKQREKGLSKREEARLEKYEEEIEEAQGIIDAIDNRMGDYLDDYVPQSQARIAERFLKYAPLKEIRTKMRAVL